MHLGSSKDLRYFVDKILNRISFTYLNAPGDARLSRPSSLQNL